MAFLLFIVYYLLVHVDSESDRDMIVNYFVHKKVASIIGITCYDDLDNILLINSSNKMNLRATTHKLNVVSSIYLLAKTSYSKLGIFLDTRCQSMSKIASIFNEATEHRMFDELLSWLVVGHNLTDILNIINDKAFGISTDFVIAIIPDFGKYEFYDIYNIFKDRGSALNITFYGDWQYESGLIINLTQPKLKRRANFHCLALKAMFYKSQHKQAEVPLNQYYGNYQDPTFKDWHHAMGYMLMKYLSEIYNFTLLAVESDWKKGDKLGPVVGALANYEVDFSGTPITMTVPRFQLLKFVHQNWDWHFRSCFIFRNPQPRYLKINQIFKPLAIEVWYLMLVFITASVVILYITQYYNYGNFENVMLLNSFIIIIGALCQQATETRIRHFSSRIAFIFVMIFSLLMFNYYSASIVSVRLDEPIFKINNSLNQLGKLKLKMASEYTGFFRFYLRRPDWDSIMFYENYWKKISESEQFKSVEIGMQSVQKGGFAYQLTIEQAYFFIKKFFSRRETCELMEVDFAVPAIPTFAVTLNNTFHEITRVGFLKIAESGLRKRRLTILENFKPRCGIDISASSVTIEEFAPYLFILSSGVLTALFICAFEIIIAKQWNFFTKQDYITI